MKKVLQWYNLLLKAGITEYAYNEADATEEGEASEGEAKGEEKPAE